MTDISKLKIECDWCFQSYLFRKIGKNADPGFPDYAIFDHDWDTCELSDHSISIDIEESD